MAYARKANTEAAKFLLMKGAIWYFAQAQADAECVATLAALNEQVKDIPPDVMRNEVIKLAIDRLSEQNVPRLLAQFRLLSAQMEIAKLRPSVRRKRADASTCRRYAELLVITGDWRAARTVFAKLGDAKMAQAVKDEIAGKGLAPGLNFDLPTEAQWEYACRAGTTSKYNNGGDTEADLKKLGRFALNQKARCWKESDESFARHEPDGKGGCLEGHTVVGSYQPNAWGLYDMHGNISEWCLDWLKEWRKQERVKRGGSWGYSANRCVSSDRSSLDPARNLGDVGFRLCLNPEGPVGASAVSGK